MNFAHVSKLLLSVGCIFSVLPLYSQVIKVSSLQLPGKQVIVFHDKQDAKQKDQQQRTSISTFFKSIYTLDKDIALYIQCSIDMKNGLASYKASETRNFMSNGSYFNIFYGNYCRGKNNDTYKKLKIANFENREQIEKDVLSAFVDIINDLPIKIYAYFDTELIEFDCDKTVSLDQKKEFFSSQAYNEFKKNFVNRLSTEILKNNGKGWFEQLEQKIDGKLQNVCNLIDQDELKEKINKDVQEKKKNALAALNAINDSADCSNIVKNIFKWIENTENTIADLREHYESIDKFISTLVELTLLQQILEDKHDLVLVHGTYDVIDNVLQYFTDQFNSNKKEHEIYSYVSQNETYNPGSVAADFLEDKSKLPIKKDASKASSGQKKYSNWFSSCKRAGLLVASGICCAIIARLAYNYFS